MKKEKIKLILFFGGLIICIVLFIVMLFINVPTEWKAHQERLAQIDTKYIEGNWEAIKIKSKEYAVYINGKIDNKVNVNALIEKNWHYRVDDAKKEIYLNSKHQSDNNFIYPIIVP